MSDTEKPEDLVLADRDPKHLRPELAGAYAHLWLWSRKILGAPIFLVEGRRSDARQDWLYEQGRTRPGLIVTHAKAGQSNHQPDSTGLGRAFDFAFKAHEPWNEKHPWEKVGIEAERIGLEWGGRWPGKKRDLPHLQLPPLR